MNDMIGISVSTADETGALVLRMTPDSKIAGGERRVTRTKTLDGGCAIYDGGFAHCDRTWKVAVYVSEDEWEALFLIAQLYSLVGLSTAEGFFRGCIESAVQEEDRAILSILIKEKAT